MNKKSFLIFIIVALLITNLLMAAVFFMGKKGKHGDNQGPKKMVIERLHLDQEQTENYEKLIVVHKSALEAYHLEIQNLKEVYYSYLSENQNSAKTTEMAKRIGEKVSEIEQLNYNHFLDIKSICTQEQLEDFDNLTKDIGKMFRPKHKKSK